MKRSLLIAEDNTGFAKVLKNTVEDAGLNAVVVDNGVDAVLRYLDGDISLVLMDVFMPRMSGVDAVRVMKRFDEHVKVILFTGNPSVSTVGDAQSLGVMDFLYKPFSTVALMEQINKHFGEI